MSSVVFTNVWRSVICVDKTRLGKTLHFFSTSSVKRWFEDGTQRIDVDHSKKKKANVIESIEEAPQPPPVDLCCMSGCPRCVFIEYADELMAYCKKTGSNSHSEIKKITKDPNMQMMIRMLMKETDS